MFQPFADMLLLGTWQEQEFIHVIATISSTMFSSVEQYSLFITQAFLLMATEYTVLLL